MKCSNSVIAKSVACWMGGLLLGVTFTSGGRGPAGLTSTVTGVISNLLPKLNWAKEHGHARVLQSSSIIVEDNKAGVLSSVQNIPYQFVAGQGMMTTSFQEVGIKTQVTPGIVGARSDSVNLKLNFEISSLIGMSAA
nr:hypothetical protein [Pirellula sp.]